MHAHLERSWDAGAALFWDLAGRDERPIRVSTWSSLAPLALPGIPEEIKRSQVERHLMHPRRYRAGTGIPSVAISEPSPLGPLSLLARPHVAGDRVAAGAADASTGL